MPPAAEMIGSFRFSTGCLPVSERATAVRELRERGILPVEPLPDRALRVQITKWSLPGAGILSGRLCGLRQEGTRQAATDDLFLGLNLAGRSTALQRQREIMIDHGDAVFLSCAEGPFTITRPTPVRFIGLRVPRRTLAPLVAGLDGPVMRVIPSETDGLKLLAKYIGALVDSQALVSTEVSRLVAAHLRDLIALSVGATRDGVVAAQARGVRAAWLEAIKRDITANLEDCALTVAAVAARHRVTPRYVHKLFESEGVTFTQFILRQRLDEAYRMLRDPRFAARSISSIAYDVGFGDISYFNRAFRQRYKVTPSDTRNCAEL